MQRKWKDELNPAHDIYEIEDERMGMSSMSPEVAVGIIGDVVSTIKYDGMFVVAIYDDSKEFFSRNNSDCLLSTRKQLFSDNPVTREIAKVMKEADVHSAVFSAEFLALGSDGRKLSLPESQSICLAPSFEQEEQMRLMIIDFISFNNLVLIGDYWERIEIAKQLFEGCKYVHPVFAVKGSSDIVADMWKNMVMKENHEGLVVRHESGIAKVKVIQNIDAIVIGMEVGGIAFERGEVRNLICCLMDDSGALRFCAAPGTGLSTVKFDFPWQSKQWWFNQIVDNNVGFEEINGKYTMLCKPQHVIEIGANAWLPKLTSSLVWDLPTQTYKKTGDRKFYVGQKPRFIKLREDKSFIPVDIRANQIPGYNPEELKGITQSKLF